MAREKKTSSDLDENQKKKPNGCSGCAGCLVVIIIFFLVVSLFSCVANSRKSDEEKWADEREREFDSTERVYDEVKDTLADVNVMDPKEFVDKMDEERDLAFYEVDELDKEFGNSDPIINKIKQAWKDVGTIASLAADGLRTNNVAEIQAITQYDDNYKDLRGEITNGLDKVVRYSKLDKAQQEEWLTTLEQDKAAIEQLNNTEMAPDQKAAQAREFMTLLEQQTNAIQETTGYDQISYPLIRAYIDVREMAVAIKHIAENDDPEKYMQEYPECIAEADEIMTEIRQYLSES